MICRVAFVHLLLLWLSSISAPAQTNSTQLSDVFERINNGSAVFTIFDVPGAQDTYPQAINRSGTVAGHWRDSNNANHGFFRSPAGKIVTFDAPGAGVESLQGTSVAGINAAGVIAGSYYDAANTLHGYIRKPDGEFTSVDYPGAATGSFMGTGITSVNERNVVIGLYNPTAGVQSGFIRSATGAFTSFSFPGSTYTNPTSVNENGVIVGYYSEINNVFGDVFQAFLRSATGEFITYGFPQSEVSSTAFSINSLGMIVGGWTSINLASPAFIGQPNGSTDSFLVPGAITSAAVAMNGKGYVTGNFSVVPEEVSAGFIRKPDGTFAIFQAPGAQSTFPAGINDSFNITGQIYAGNPTTIHGFLLTP